MPNFDFKTATPDTSISGSEYWFGADSQSAATPSIYSVGGLKTYLLGGGSLAITAGKTLTATNSLTLTGTDGTTMTFPSTSATLAALGIANLFTTAQTITPLTDVVGLTINGGPAGTTNILQVLDSSNNVLAAFDKDGKLTLGRSSALTGQLKFANASNANILTLQAGATSGSLTFTLPTADGTSGQVLQTNGSGVLSWKTDATNSPGGSDTQLQFNNSGSFGADSTLTFNSTSKLLTANRFSLAGNISSAAWTTNGIRYANAAATITDTTSSGTVATAYTDLFGGNTIAASNSTTYTNYYTMFVSPATAGTNVALTNAYALGLGGSVNLTSGNLVFAGDVILSRRGAANLRLGAADAAAPVAQTLSVQSVVAGTSNTAGTNFTITGSQGTGNAAGGSIIFQVAPAGSSGTSQNTLTNALSIASTGGITVTTNVNTTRNIILNASVSASPGLEIRSATVPDFSGVGFIPNVTTTTVGILNQSSATNGGVSLTGFNSNTDAQAPILLTGYLSKTNGNTQSAVRFNGLKWNGTTSSQAIGSTEFAAQFYTSTTLLLSINGGGLLQFAGTTNSFPALKRSSTTLQVRLADDSADAPINALSGTFTDNTANTSAISSTGYSLTGSSSVSLVDLAGTWNTTGTPSAIKLNITNTASNAASNLIDVGTGGGSYVSQFKVSVTGDLTLAGGITLSAKNIATDTTTGTKIGTATGQKLGFFNATPVAQQNTTGTTNGFTAGGGTTVDSGATFTGDTGSTAYTIGDVVRALKTLGLLAA